MWNKINELKYRLVFKYTVFFVVGVFLPLVLMYGKIIAVLHGNNQFKRLLNDF